MDIEIVTVFLASMTIFVRILFFWNWISRSLGVKLERHFLLITGYYLGKGHPSFWGYFEDKTRFPAVLP